MRVRINVEKKEQKRRRKKREEYSGEREETTNICFFFRLRVVRVVTHGGERNGILPRSNIFRRVLLNFRIDGHVDSLGVCETVPLSSSASCDVQ